MPGTSASLLRLDPIAYFAMGGMLLFFGIFIFVLAPLPILLGICLPPTFIPAPILIALGILAWRREHRLLEFADWIRSQRRIKMDLMAQRLGRTRFETERLLGEAIDRGFVRGAIDRSADEFVLEATSHRQFFAGKCPSCGGEVSLWYFPEERFNCPYCERPIEHPPAA